MPAGQSTRSKALELRAQANQLQIRADGLRAWADNWDAGAVGEERVAAALAKADPNSLRVLHDRPQGRGSDTVNLDHLVVTPAGVFLIDAKNWKGVTVDRDGSLWQQRYVSSSGQGTLKDDELRSIRRQAGAVHKALGATVTPVLCLAGENADAFGPAREVGGVHVVPLSQLQTWLEARPLPRRAVDLDAMQARLNLAFPEVADRPYVAEHEVSPLSRGTGSTGPRPIRPGRSRRSPRRAVRVWPRFVVSAALLLAVVLAGPSLVSAAGVAAKHGITRVFASTTTPPAHPAVSPRLVGLLDDWRIRAGLFADADNASLLAATPDSSLAYRKDGCRTQRSRLVPLRAGLLNAPDPQLQAAAKRFDTATTALLHACIANDPVSLHHAEGAMTAAASTANTRYNRLLGIDPGAYNARRVL